MTVAAPSSLQVYSAEHTAALLPFPALIDALADTLRHYEAGAIHSPERMVVPFDSAVLLSMPAVAKDIVAHKLITVQPANSARALPAIHGLVTAFDAITGTPLFVLDGPEVTGRRTAAISMLGLRTLGPAAVRNILLYGTGTQAHYHLQALADCYPNSTVYIKGRTLENAQTFCAQHETLPLQLHPIDDVMPDKIDVVITVTTSLQAIYDLPASPARLVIGVGAFRPEMAEIGANTLAGSTLYVDDPVGAPHEAGDLMQAGVDWAQVRSLASALDQQPDRTKPIVFKSVGTAAWDLAACRLVRQQLHSQTAT
ncbi:delta(1)-pyrroline-2-carboxylate reductase family protein [Lampropedia puyangensis]|uniref:Delta(1)-pyrroline-2-carboxylate reductase family protein n=1 Tax=Lampropedia puyangensis TaxID=1330072 RepID=A0A4V6T2Q1_9BURK|nr:bifunctional Delta(1)-pyrroline-2-carboxylate/Delta(1)-piperideine-2-carboxylate reductase [Lampropedia puyangensis]THU01076.1 delta(1)-pyrroline-2-carboxylate reductase family protein [Lampropedia puyangensis]